MSFTPSPTSCIRFAGKFWRKMKTVATASCEVCVKLLPVGFVFLAGCVAKIHTGTSDYSPVDAEGKASPGKYRKIISNNESVIISGDTITVNLLHAYIDDFHEANKLRKAWGSTNDEKSGEIAIIASVRELGSGRDFDFSSGAYKSGRLVYYGEGIHPGSHLNFSNLPIYGPINYSGKPLAISFYIVEVDTQGNEQTAALFKTLSSIGKTAYPPSAKVLSVLDTIGSELLKHQKDDLELQYDKVFNSYSESSGRIGQPILQEGNYAVLNRQWDMKNDDKKLPLVWDNILVESTSGLLYKTVGAGKDFKIDGTYMVYQIIKGLDATDLNSAERMEKLSQFVERSKSDSVLDLEESSKKIVRMLNRDQNMAKAKELIESLRKTVGYNSDSSVRNADFVSIKTELIALLAENGEHLRTADRQKILMEATKILDKNRQTVMTLQELTSVSLPP